MFNHKSFNEANLWFLKKEENDDMPFQKKSLIENEKKTIETILSQQVYFRFK